MIKYSKVSLKLFFAAKVLILAAVLILLWFKVEENKISFTRLYDLIRASWRNQGFTYAIILLLMPLNWLMEAWKWKLLSEKIISISLVDAYKVILRGVTLSFITPHGVGDYLARIISVNHPKRKSLVGAVLISRWTQMLVTAIFGYWGLSFMYSSEILLVIFLAGIAIIFVGIVILKYAVRQSFLKDYLSIISDYSIIDLLSVFGIALLRYLIFLIQLILVIMIFIPDIQMILAAAGSTFIFLMKSIIPTFSFLSDLGIREYAAINFFEKFDFPIDAVVSATLTLWFINILLPTLLGLPFVMSMKKNVIS